MSDEGLAPGKRLSEIRQQQGLSQRRAAELSGLTHSAISTIEQDKVSPAISTLQKLLKILTREVDILKLETELSAKVKEQIDQNQREYFMREQIKAITEELGEADSPQSQGVSMKLVHNGNPNRTLAMIFETYQPGTTTGERIKHQGEEIGTVLEGEIVLTINGQDYHLVAGQSYAINTGIPHSFSNTSAGICRIISAHTPTTF
jgi:HTH-type transcriptional repressor of puuD